MVIAIVIILAILWFIGYIPISGISIPNLVLFTINNHPITLWNILILIMALPVRYLAAPEAPLEAPEEEEQMPSISDLRQQAGQLNPQ